MTYLAQFLMSLIASMLVSGNAALQANSDRHFTASWNESMVDEKYFSNTDAGKEMRNGFIININLSISSNTPEPFIFNMP